jgi:GTPase involved in cell partitioning and DNA repair
LNLAHLQHSYRAENGGHGQGNNKAGRSGAHTYINIPVGCLITEYKPLPKTRDEEEVSDSASFQIDFYLTIRTEEEEEDDDDRCVVFFSVG